MAYTNTFSITDSIGTNTGFRTWGNTISRELQASGLVKTSDTGQIDWTTVACPAAATNIQGYEMYRFDDALQSTYPVYLKFQYGASVGANTSGRVTLTVANGTNGAGTLTGAVSNAVYTEQSSAVAAATGRLTGDTNRILLMYPRGGSTSGFTSVFLSVERTHLPTGADTGTGVMIAYQAGSGNRITQGFVWTPGGDAPNETNLGVLMPIAGNTGQSGANTSVYPVYWTNGIFLNPSMNFLAYFHSDIPANTPIAISYYTASRTYLPLGNTVISNTSWRNQGGHTSYMIRWE